MRVSRYRKNVQQVASEQTRRDLQYIRHQMLRWFLHMQLWLAGKQEQACDVCLVTIHQSLIVSLLVRINDSIGLQR